MLRRAKIPHHLTGFWLPHYSDDPRHTGSTGAGLLLEAAEVRFHNSGLVYNGDMLSRDVDITIASPYPIGYGYAASAVVNIAKFLAFQNPPEAYVSAHVEEVRNLTGLGDVLAISTGGCLVVRVKPGAPGIGAAYSLQCPKLTLVTIDVARYNTGVMLRELAPYIREHGREAIAQFFKDPDFYNFLYLARYFSRRVGFLTEQWEERLSKASGVVGYFAKKGVVAVVVERDRVGDITSITRDFNVHITELVDRRIELE